MSEDTYDENGINITQLQREAFIEANNKMKKNKYNLTPITYETYRKLRAFKYEVVGHDNEVRLWKPMCYKDNNRIKFYGWNGKQRKWLDYAYSLKLKEGVHYAHSESNSWRGISYSTIILYVE